MREEDKPKAELVREVRALRQRLQRIEHASATSKFQQSARGKADEVKDKLKKEECSLILALVRLDLLFLCEFFNILVVIVIFKQFQLTYQLFV